MRNFLKRHVLNWIILSVHNEHPVVAFTAGHPPFVQLYKVTAISGQQNQMMLRRVTEVLLIVLPARPSSSRRKNLMSPLLQ